MPIEVHASAVDVAAALVPADAGMGRWQPHWVRTKRAAWTLTIRDSRGVAVFTRSSATPAMVVGADWAGPRRLDRTIGRAYTWTLVLTSADGIGGQKTVTGSVLASPGPGPTPPGPGR